MKKLILCLDALQVETFDPVVSVGELSGSVAAYQESALGPCPTYNPGDAHCYFSLPYQPGGVCTPVCGNSARCLITQDPENC